MLRLVFVLLLAWVGGLFYFISPPSISEKPTDAIVVLTGGSGRVEEGLRLLKKGMAPKLFISGVHEDVTYEELSADASLSKRVFLGHKATTTFENALETKTWVREQAISSIRLVTAHYHIHRSMLEYKHLMPHLRIIPHPIVPAVFRQGWWHNKKTLGLVVSEYNKFLITYLRIMEGSFLSL